MDGSSLKKAQLFIVTYARDLDWLAVSLRSIAKYWTSGLPPLIVANKDSMGKLPGAVHALGCTVHWVDLWSDGRRDQIYLKMIADTLVSPEAEAVLFLDSDCLFTRPVTPDLLCDPEGRPFIRMRSYASALAEGINGRRLNEIEAWSYRGYADVVRETLTGSSPRYEYMQAMPYLFYTETVRRTREAILRRTGKSLKEVMLGYHSSLFSEFNLFGAYAHLFAPERYCFLLPEEYGPKCVREFHSWTQTPAGERAEIERLLA